MKLLHPELLIYLRPAIPLLTGHLKVEGGALIASRWILASLRNRVFFSLDELNNAIWDLLDKYNEKEFQKREGSRKTNFENFEKNPFIT